MDWFSEASPTEMKSASLYLLHTTTTTTTATAATATDTTTTITMADGPI